MRRTGNRRRHRGRGRHRGESASCAGRHRAEARGRCDAGGARRNTGRRARRRRPSADARAESRARDERRRRSAADTSGRARRVLRAAAPRRHVPRGGRCRRSAPARSARAASARGCAAAERRRRRATAARRQPRAVDCAASARGAGCIAWNGTVGASYARRRGGVGARRAGRARRVARGAAVTASRRRTLRRSTRPTPTVITPPQTEQRARTPAAGTFGGINAKDRLTLRTGNVHFASVADADSPRLRSRHLRRRRRIGAPIDRIHGAGQRLRVALHFGRERADLRRVREPPAFVRHDADRHRHQWYTVKLSAAILAEKISGSSIRLRVLKRDQRVEDRHDLGAHLVHVAERNDVDEIVAADVPDETVFATHALHDVVQDLRENPNDAIALVVRVAIVEFLEVIEIGVARREQRVRATAAVRSRLRSPRRPAGASTDARRDRDPSDAASRRVESSTSAGSADREPPRRRRREIRRRTTRDRSSR